MVQKFIDAWKKKIVLRKAYNNFTGGSSIYMREVTGNYPKRNFTSKNNVYKNIKNKHNILKNYILSKNIWTPTLYKGLTGKNAKEFLESVKLKDKGFLKHALFHTKTITSTSTQAFQAEQFAHKGVVLVIARNKRPAMIAGQFGIHARQPREKEVTLPPGSFVLRYKNKNTGRYHVDFIPNRN